jgi:mannose-6-phosphate isomerase-like protein (cupin superfamily)
MHIDEEVQLVTVGAAIYIPALAKQYIHNCGEEPLVFLCIVDPAWRLEDEIIFE